MKTVFARVLVAAAVIALPASALASTHATHHAAVAKKEKKKKSRHHAHKIGARAHTPTAKAAP